MGMTRHEVWDYYESGSRPGVELVSGSLPHHSHHRKYEGLGPGESHIAVDLVVEWAY